MITMRRAKFRFAAIAIVATTSLLLGIVVPVFSFAQAINQAVIIYIGLTTFLEMQG